MEGQSAIWMIARKRKTGERIGEMLREARLINPVKLIETEQELKALLHSGHRAPQLIFLDLGLPDEFVAVALECICECGWQTRVIAIVDGQSEDQLDHVYEAGVKTYVRDNVSFADFLERTRVLGLRFAIERSEEC